MAVSLYILVNLISTTILSKTHTVGDGTVQKSKALHNAFGNIITLQKNTQLAASSFTSFTPRWTRRVTCPTWEVRNTCKVQPEILLRRPLYVPLADKPTKLYSTDITRKDVARRNKRNLYIMNTEMNIKIHGLRQYVVQ
jgi:hypothetical protein